MKWWHRNLQGFRIGGLSLLSSQWSPTGRRIIFASYHHPKRMCWLWCFEGFATRKLLPRISRLPGYQAKTYIDLPFYTLLFMWQDEGRFTDPRDRRIRETLGIKDWPKQVDRH